VVPELEEAIANAPLWARRIRLKIANPNAFDGQFGSDLWTVAQALAIAA
jgi:hypothetical protein